MREVLAHGLVATEGGEGGQAATGTSSLARAGTSSWARGLRPWLRGRGRRLRSAREATDIARAVQFLMSVTARKTVCFVVSDFFDRGYEEALITANRRHDVIAVLISDPRELELPGIGLVEMSDAESGRSMTVDLASASFRREFEEMAESRVKELERRLRRAGIDFIHIDASGSVVDPLVRFFRMRERRRRS